MTDTHVLENAPGGGGTGPNHPVHPAHPGGVFAGQRGYAAEIGALVDSHPVTPLVTPVNRGELGNQGSDSVDYRSFEKDVNTRIEEERRPNTARARDQDWRSWSSFCSAHGAVRRSADADALAAFAAWLADGSDDRLALAPASIRRRISGVVCGWRDLGLVIPENVSEKALRIAENHERRLLEANLPTGRGQAPALELRDLRRIVRALPDTTAGKRDRSMILIGFGIAARRSELAHLDVTDIVETSEGLDIRVRFSKTKPRNPGVPPGRNDETCPVTAWREWLEASGVTDGAAFRQVTRYDRVGGRMSPRAVGEAIRRAGLNVDVHVTGHSLRAGLATEARRAGRDIVQIARQGGWSETSDSLYRYIRTVDKWTDNAVKGVL